MTFETATRLIHIAAGFTGLILGPIAIGALKRALGREPYESVRFWKRSRWESSGLASAAEMREQEQAITAALVKDGPTGRGR